MCDPLMYAAASPVKLRDALQQVAALDGMLADLTNRTAAAVAASVVASEACPAGSEEQQDAGSSACTGTDSGGISTLLAQARRRQQAAAEVERALGTAASAEEGGAISADGNDEALPASWATVSQLDEQLLERALGEEGSDAALAANPFDTSGPEASEAGARLAEIDARQAGALESSLSCCTGSLWRWSGHQAQERKRLRA